MPGKEIIKAFGNHCTTIRKYPRRFERDEETLKWRAVLGDEVQKYADVLEAQLREVWACNGMRSD